MLGATALIALPYVRAMGEQSLPSRCSPSRWPAPWGQTWCSTTWCAHASA